MRRGISIVSIAGCATTAVPAPPLASPVTPPPSRPPSPPPPPPPSSDWRCEPGPPLDGTGPSARVLARLAVCTGHLPGTTLTVTAKPAPDRCGGIAIEVERDPTRSLVVGDDLDETSFFEAAMTLEMPDPDDRTTLDDWTEHVALVDYGNASSPLRAQPLARASDAEQVLALARLVTIERRFAETFARARIGTAYLEEPARTAWCDVPAHAVEGVVALMEADAARCRGLAERVPRGWWTDACAEASPR